MGKKLLAAFLTLAPAVAMSQESETTYNFLRLPVSAHVAALGGENITICDDDPTVIFHNPALLSNVSDMSINLNFMTYMEGSKTASASFVKECGRRGMWGMAAQYMDYGDIREVTEDNIEVGDVSAKDVMIMGTYNYNLTNRLAGGVSAKFITSSLAGYNSIAVAVDLGLNYYDEDLDLSFSAVARNLGGQVKAYEDDFEKIPIDVQIGATKRLGHSPLRFSLTMSELNDWDDRFWDHFAMGVDVLLSQNIYIAGGYNFRRSYEMKISDSDDESSHGAGFSFGAGLRMRKFKIDFAYAKYHVSTYSLNFNVTYVL